MPKPKTVPNKLLIGFSDEQLHRLDHLRRSQGDLPTRSEAVRRLVDRTRPSVLPETWAGLLRLSLVTCPIVLISATIETDINLDEISRKSGRKIVYVKVDSGTGEAVANDDVASGYQVENGSYLEITRRELDEIAPTSVHSIAIDEFVPRDEIDTLYVMRSYYVLPDGKAGQDAFAVIHGVMYRSELAALARITLGGRERMIALEARENCLVGMLLRYPDEVSSAEQHIQMNRLPAVSKDMIDLAMHIVEQKTGHFQPEKFKDFHRQALTSFLEKKQNSLGKSAKETKVVSLLDALRQSVSDGK